MTTKLPLHSPSLAARLKEYRTQFVHKKQKEGADILGVTQSTLSYYESSRTPIPATLVKLLAEKHRMSYEWFFEGTGSPEQGSVKKKDLITSTIELKGMIADLETNIKILTANQNHLFKYIERMEKDMEQLKANK